MCHRCIVRDCRRRPSSWQHGGRQSQVRHLHRMPRSERPRSRAEPSDRRQARGAAGPGVEGLQIWRQAQSGQARANRFAQRPRHGRSGRLLCVSEVRTAPSLRAVAANQQILICANLSAANPQPPPVIMDSGLGPSVIAREARARRRGEPAPLTRWERKLRPGEEHPVASPDRLSSLLLVFAAADNSRY